MSVFPSPSKSYGERRIEVAVPPPQNPLIIVNVAPFEVVPATDCPIVPSTVNCPLDIRPPPPAMTDCVIVYAPPDCATAIELTAETQRKRDKSRETEDVQRL